MYGANKPQKPQAAKKTTGQLPNATIRSLRKSFTWKGKVLISDNHGGGVFQAVKNDIIVTHRDDLDTDCEIIWIQCQIQSKRKKSLFFVSFYRPNRNDIDSLQEFDSSLFKLGNRSSTNNVIVAGDFNAPDHKWNDLEPTTN